jgi:antirestriction protein ArdC
MLMHTEIRQSITNSIVEHLESGKVAPWRRPWTVDRNAGAPANVVSKRNYSGINPLVLEVASMRYGFQSKWWATFNQWKQLGGRVMRRPENVKPGQWATNIVFWKPITRTETDANGYEREEKYYLLKTFNVFCVDQVEGKHLDYLRFGHADAKLAPDEVEARSSSAEAAIEATGADIRHGGNKAYYSTDGDYIVLPHRHQFSVAEYYETAFHELTHWTEHASRLNWDRSKPENSYALGELIAELGGCFIAVALGVPTAERLENHASYLNGWLDNMKSDPKFIFAAAAQAAKAADFVLHFSREPVEEREPATVF